MTQGNLRQPGSSTVPQRFRQEHFREPRVTADGGRPRAFRAKLFRLQWLDGSRCGCRLLQRCDSLLDKVPPAGPLPPTGTVKKLKQPASRRDYPPWPVGILSPKPGAIIRYCDFRPHCESQKVTCNTRTLPLSLTSPNGDSFHDFWCSCFGVAILEDCAIKFPLSILKLGSFVDCAVEAVVVEGLELVNSCEQSGVVDR